jgi:hypothetical protein
VYAQRHAGRDNKGHLGDDLQADDAPAARESFAGAYGDHHADKDTHSGLGAGRVGLVPNADRAAGEAFADYYQGQHAGRDTKSNMVGSSPKRHAQVLAKAPKIPPKYPKAHAHMLAKVP